VTVDENAGLAADIDGKLDQPRRQLRGAELRCWNTSAVEPLQCLNLAFL